MRNSTRSRFRQLHQALQKRPIKRDVLSPLEVAEKMWSSLDTSVSLGLSLLVKNGQIEDALKVKFDPSRYNTWDVETARNDYQAIAFLSKCPLVIDGVDREAAAWKKFQEAEEQCRLTNARFRSLRDHPGSKNLGDVNAILHSAQRKISLWLGDLDAREWASVCRFGPGVDSLHKGYYASAYHKLEKGSVTKDFYSGALGLIRDHPGWFRYYKEWVWVNNRPLPKLVTEYGNRVMFVPKTALIDRSIAVEPGMNIFAQLGLGNLIRARLKRVGLDLDNADPNRGLALIGSRDGTVATIDLSSASDTLARELVRELLPEPWFVALDWVRSKLGSYRGETFRYEKFSSMGNGYTFELESMIFYALALSCTELKTQCDHRKLDLVRSFGDDITVPTEVVPLLAEVLEYCGFTFNSTKSFHSGVFRESCGMDFFSGVNIRPYYLKESRFGTVESLFRLANGVRRVASRRNRGYGCDELLHPVWRHVVKRIPANFRELCSPPTPVTFRDKRLAAEVEYELGDSALSGNLDEAMSSPFVSFSKETQGGWLYAALVGVSRSFRAECFGSLRSFALYDTRDGAGEKNKTTYDSLSVRGGSRRQLKRGLFAPLWPDLGPWV